MGRKEDKVILSEEEKKMKLKEYHKLYYKQYKQHICTDTVIVNAIKRLSKNDDYIKTFILQIGKERFINILDNM